MLLTVDITGKCNLQCKTCYNSEFAKTSPSEEVVNELLDNIPSTWDLYFLGGEPLLKKDFVDTLKQSKKAGHNTSFSTNATLIKSFSDAEKIIETDVDSIYISLDGPDQKTNDAIRGDGSFDKCLNGLSLLDRAIYSVGAKTKLCVSVTATSENLNKLPLIPRLLSDMGVYVEKLGIVPVSTTGRASGKNDWRVEPSAWLDSCEAMCSEWRDRDKLAFLCLPNSELTIRYLSAKYDLILPESIADCPILQKRDIGRFLPTGEVVPCSGRLDLLREYNSEHPGDGITSIADLMINKEEVFGKFIESLSQSASPSAPICEQCPYHTNCQVCPLEYTRDNEKRNERPTICAETALRINEHYFQSTKDNSDFSRIATDIKCIGKPYIKKRRYGARIVFFPKEEQFVLADDKLIGKALEELLFDRSPEIAIQNLMLEGISPVNSVNATDVAMRVLDRIANL